MICCMRPKFGLWDEIVVEPFEVVEFVEQFVRTKTNGSNGINARRERQRGFISRGASQR